MGGALTGCRRFSSSGTISFSLNGMKLASGGTMGSFLLLSLAVLMFFILLSCSYKTDQPSMGQTEAATALKACISLPPAPTDLSLRIVPEGFRLVWKPVPDWESVTGYEIYRAAIFSGPYELVGKVNRDMSSYTDRAVSPEIIYFYKVRAVGEDRCSPFSKEAAGEIPGLPER